MNKFLLLAFLAIPNLSWSIAPKYCDASRLLDQQTIQSIENKYMGIWSDWLNKNQISFNPSDMHFVLGQPTLKVIQTPDIENSYQIVIFDQANNSVLTASNNKLSIGEPWHSPAPAFRYTIVGEYKFDNEGRQIGTTCKLWTHLLQAHIFNVETGFILGRVPQETNVVFNSYVE